MFRNIKPDKYFLKEACPYSKKRLLNKTRVYTAGGGLGIVVIALILVFGGKAERKAAQTNEEMARAVKKMGENGSQPNSSPQEAKGLDGFPDRNHRGSASRSYSASQIVSKGAGRVSVDGLPMGSTFTAKLVNTVLSSDNEAPVIAEVTDDVMPKNSLVIPRGSRAIGQASFDETAQRLKVRFHTLVYPEGDQHALSGLGLLPDGSSGLLGDYHSKAFQKQAGRFVGDFVSGLASGMIQKNEGPLRMAYNPGSLKNGLLNGVSKSTSDQARQYSDEMASTHGYLEVPSGSVFLIYLEKEYAP